MSEADEGLQLRSGRVVPTTLTPMLEGEDDSVVENVEELRARVIELEQKLAMSEQAVSDKDEELHAIRGALGSAKSEAAMDLDQARDEAEREKSELERELQGTIQSLKLQNERLHESLEECNSELKNQEVKPELNRLRGLENLRQTTRGVFGEDSEVREGAGYRERATLEFPHYYCVCSAWE